MSFLLKKLGGQSSLMIYGKHLIFENFFIIPVNDDDVSGMEHGFHGMAVYPAGDQIGALAGGADVKGQPGSYLTIHHYPGNAHGGGWPAPINVLPPLRVF